MRFLTLLASCLLTMSNAAFAASPATACGAASQEIIWTVKGRLAIFAGDDARDRTDRLLEQITTRQGKLVDGGSTTEGSAYADIVEALVDTGHKAKDSKGLFLQTFWNRDQERYEGRERWLHPPHADIVATFASDARDCVWTLDGTKYPGRCDSQRFTIGRQPNSGHLKGDLSVVDTAGRSSQTCVLIDEKLIVGFGDSYASGEGNPDRPTQWNLVPGVSQGPLKEGHGRAIDTLWDRNRHGPLAYVPEEADAQWWDNSCHRSLLSQQSLAAMNYAAVDRHRIVTFLSFACSGATVIDGVVGPRFEAPGTSRLDKTKRLGSAALQFSQIEQALQVLCGEPVTYGYEPIPSALKVWQQLQRPKVPAAEHTGQVRLARCPKLLINPDVMLLSIGGNDVGFGGVGFWAIMPAKDRLWLPIDFISGSSVTADRKATKADFGLVCPFETDERRCRKSGFTARTLLNELPGVYHLMDEMLEKAGLGRVPVKIQMSYPPVAFDENGELCGRLWRTATTVVNEMRNEPWIPLYNTALDMFRVGVITPTAGIAPWDFGIWNSVDLKGCLAGDRSEAREMCTIYGDVYLPLNKAVAGHENGWTVISADQLPQRHGLCAASAPLSSAITAYDGDGDKVQALARLEFGWPRYRNGWLDGWPAPQQWHAYVPRARWYRTATDSALTQTVFDGGGTRASKRLRGSSERLEEAVSGTLHPTLQMHAAMAELMAAQMIKEENRQ